MKKGCLTGIAIFFAICLLFSMCSSDSNDNTNNETESTPTESLILNSTEATANLVLHEHTFEEATCKAPKTCNTCGITEGDPLEHTWVDATCSNPKTCSVCETTEGTPLEHTWVDATCTTKKTCSICSEETGYFAEHNYSNGKCQVCKAADPSDPKNITVWVPTNGGKKYHSYSGCSNMKNPKKTTQAKAEKSGFKPCSRCN